MFWKSWFKSRQSPDCCSLALTSSCTMTEWELLANREDGCVLYAPSDLSQDWFKQKCAYGVGRALSKYHPEPSLKRPDKTILPFLIRHRLCDWISSVIISALSSPQTRSGCFCTSYHHAASLFCRGRLLCRLLSTNSVTTTLLLHFIVFCKYNHQAGDHCVL